MEPNTPTQRPHTTLISVFGWVMLVVGALTTAVSAINLVLFSWMASENNGELVPAENLADLPPLFTKILDNIIPLLGMMIVSAILMAVAGFGVVRRDNWGRLLSIFLLAASIVWAFVMAWVGISTGADLSGDIGVGGVFNALYNIALAMVTAVLHGWIIWKLRTPAVRSEFGLPISESNQR